MPEALVWGIAVLALATILDRLFLWMETRGWIYYRRTRGRGGGALYHTLEIHSVFDPGIQQIQEIKVKEERREDESGDPPAPDEDPPGPDGDIPADDPDATRGAISKSRGETGEVDQHSNEGRALEGEHRPRRERGDLVSVNRKLHFGHLLLVVGIVASSGCRQAVQSAVDFPLVETTIADVHAAFRDGRLTSRVLVGRYLERIEAYDRTSGLNSIVILNPDAIAEAEALDEEFRRTGRLRPLHGIPVIVKDNYDTEGLQTTGGSRALEGSIPPDDAYQVRMIREAGAIVLAKSNMAEWAFSPYMTESSIAGVTRNPYDLDRVPAGSSGGTAAAISANLGVVGLGTDTGNSIRGPSSHNALVGIRSTMGLTSRDGIIPLYLRNDIGGPMARTVEDAVRVLDVIAGYDPADPITRRSEGRMPPSYLDFLDSDGLEGARLGVFRRYLDAPTGDGEIRALTEAALRDLAAQGAEIIDPFDIADFEELTDGIWCDVFRHDVNEYLASLGGAAPRKTLAEVVASGLYSPYIERRLQRALTVDTPPAEREPPCLDLYSTDRNIAFREAVLAAMERDEIDAIVYPTWSNPPRLVGDLESPAGDNSQLLSPQTGFPAITVPTGYTDAGLPGGITFVGRLFGEPDLIRYAYAYEAATKHRRPPGGFPELP